MSKSNPNEGENKRWLACVKEWVEREKKDASSIIFAPEGCPLLEDFKRQERELVEYLMSLDDWLKKYGIKEALKELPSVGMLLSQLCKMQLVFISDSVSAVLINCIVHLSNILHGAKADDTASKRAKKWAVDHFSKMVSVDVDGVHMFLMEEFGISPEEYMKEHIHQSSLQLLEMSQQPKSKNKNKTSIDTVFEFYKMVNDELLTPAFEAMICIDTSKNLSVEGQDSLSDNQFLWISENKTLTNRFSIESLHRLFRQSIASFENYVINIIEKIIESYPGIHQETIKTYIEESKLLDLCSLDTRYHLSIMQVIKGSFLVIGPHHGIIEFFRTFMTTCRQSRLTANIEQFNVKTFSKYDSLGSSFVNSPIGLSGELREEYLRKLETNLSHICDSEMEEEEIEIEFEIWWCNLQYIEWIDEAILLLFEGSRQNVSLYIQLFIRFFYPTEYNEMTSHLQPLTSYVYALRNLLQKTHIQHSDLEFLSSSLKRKVPASDMNCITSLLTILNVMFMAKSCGGGSIADRCLENILDGGGDDAVYWFLYTIQLLLKPTHSRTICKNPTFKDTVTNRLNALCNHENNGDVLNCFDGDNAQGMNTTMKRDMYIACCKIKKDLIGC